MFLPRRLLVVLYLGIGVVVAASRDYLEDVETARQLASALLAIVLWPLLLFGIDLHVR